MVRIIFFCIKDIGKIVVETTRLTNLTYHFVNQGAHHPLGNPRPAISFQGQRNAGQRRAHSEKEISSNPRAFKTRLSYAKIVLASHLLRVTSHCTLRKHRSNS